MINHLTWQKLELGNGVRVMGGSELWAADDAGNSSVGLISVFFITLPPANDFSFLQCRGPAPVDQRNSKGGRRRVERLAYFISGLD